ncbi:MAG: NADAR family protein, partial [Clostridiales bacterium]|nr:NADAR family protein [Clostridiales bacterium]
KQKHEGYLLSTNDKILVEASPLDTIWGIGYSKDNDKAANPQNWRGLNLLGFALMEVRDELKRVYKNYDKINWTQL